MKEIRKDLKDGETNVIGRQEHKGNFENRIISIEIFFLRTGLLRFWDGID